MCTSQSPRSTPSLLQTPRMPARLRQENTHMGSKTLILNPKPGEADGPAEHHPTVTLGIQSDTAFHEETKRLQGRDLCSVADLSVGQMAAIMELAHAVKSHPADFRHSLEARQ